MFWTQIFSETRFDQLCDVFIGWISGMVTLALVKRGRIGG